VDGIVLLLYTSFTKRAVKTQKRRQTEMYGSRIKTGPNYEAPALKKNRLRLRGILKAQNKTSQY
jgi:hypothetical protein